MNEISFSYEKMGTKPRFEEEAKGNSERAYLELICTSEFFKKLKLHESLRRVQFCFLKKSQVQINSKLNEKTV